MIELEILPVRVKLMFSTRFFFSVWDISRSCSRLGNNNIGIHQFSICLATLAVFIRGDHKGMPCVLEKFPKSKFAGNTAKQLTGGKINPLGGWQTHTVGVFFQLGKIPLIRMDVLLPIVLLIVIY